MGFLVQLRVSVWLERHSAVSTVLEKKSIRHNRKEVREGRRTLLASFSVGVQRLG